MSNATQYGSADWLSPEDYIAAAPTLIIYDGLVKAQSVLAKYHNVMVSVSGGADSDNMIDIVEHLRPRDDDHKVTYVWFDTGIEMAATKRHLTYLEERYGIEVVRRRAKVTVPAAVAKYGQPYLSKESARRIHELQLHNFDWSDGTTAELNEQFPNCKAGIAWWNGDKGKYSISKINHNYMHENPPSFSISDDCCKYAKKNPSAEMEKELSTDLVLLGIRMSEGGVRASKKGCFDRAGRAHKTDMYYPCFWWKDSDKAAFEQTYGIIHSDAYTVYGFSRTGCAGCPFNSKFDEDLQILRQHEPQLANAVEHIFAPSYEYTRGYRKYKESRRKSKGGETKGDKT